MAGKLWDYVESQLHKLKCVGARLTLWNGGQSVETRFTMKNRAGLSEGVSFENNSKFYFSCPDFFDEVRIHRIERGGVEVCVRTPGEGGVEEHLRRIKQFFDISAVEQAEMAIVDRQIEDLTRRLNIAKSVLKRAQEV